MRGKAVVVAKAIDPHLTTSLPEFMHKNEATILKEIGATQQSINAQANDTFHRRTGEQR